MKHSVALIQLKGRVAWDQLPALTEAEVTDLVDQSRMPDRRGNPIEDVREWEADTAYVVGDRVTDLAGHAYVCTEDGISGSSRPVWAATVTDGTTAWERDTVSRWTPTYDGMWAAAEGWALKGAKAASMIDVTADGATFHRDQVLAHCQSMHEQYARRIAVSVRVR